MPDEPLPRAPARRIASLLPAATEIVCALGRRADLVGVSHECDFPPDVRGLPVLTSSRVRAQGPSVAVDRDVRALVRDALGVFEVDVEALRRVAPEVVLTQDLCDVCAVPRAEVERALRQLAAPDVRVVNLAPTRLADIWRDVQAVGDALGAGPEARELVADLQRRVEAVRARAARLPARPKVLSLEWLDPPMVGGTWMPELIELAGGVPLVAKAGEGAPTLAREELAKLRPDVVLIKPCGFDLARSEMESEAIAELVGATSWPAALKGEVFLADGNAYFNRPGPRIVDSLEILAACLHGFEFRDLSARHAHAFVRVAQHGRSN